MRKDFISHPYLLCRNCLSFHCPCLQSWSHCPHLHASPYPSNVPPHRTASLVRGTSPDGRGCREIPCMQMTQIPPNQRIQTINKKYFPPHRVTSPHSLASRGKNTHYEKETSTSTPRRLRVDHPPPSGPYDLLQHKHRLRRTIRCGNCHSSPTCGCTKADGPICPAHADIPRQRQETLHRARQGGNCPAHRPQEPEPCGRQPHPGRNRGLPHRMHLQGGDHRRGLADGQQWQAPRIGRLLLHRHEGRRAGIAHRRRQGNAGGVPPTLRQGHGAVLWGEIRKVLASL